MSNDHAHSEADDNKKHADIVEREVKAVQERVRQASAGHDPVPAAEDGGHSHSQAAHIGSTPGHEETKRPGDQRIDINRVENQNLRNK